MSRYALNFNSACREPRLEPVGVSSASVRSMAGGLHRGRPHSWIQLELPRAAPIDASPVAIPVKTVPAVERRVAFGLNGANRQREIQSCRVTSRFDPA